MTKPSGHLSTESFQAASGAGSKAASREIWLFLHPWLFGVDVKGAASLPPGMREQESARAHSTPRLSTTQALGPEGDLSTSWMSGLWQPGGGLISFTLLLAEATLLLELTSRKRSLHRHCRPSLALRNEFAPEQLRRLGTERRNMGICFWGRRRMWNVWAAVARKCGFGHFWGHDADCRFDSFTLSPHAKWEVDWLTR